jgi:hypothetical protein
MRKDNPNHPIFCGANSLEDSCVFALQRANELHLHGQRKRQEGELFAARQESDTETAHYQATDDDLPEIFWTEKEECR